MHMPRIYFWPTVHEITGLSRTTIWRMEKVGKFPKRRQISSGRVGWLASEVNPWAEGRPVVGGEA
ncbi:MAG: hypothetical protein BA869_01480 [Desulfuromonadales bacterium C00003107]|nr:MAG: hypothetical protein BA869_01480 [Desulfuromonadales bacterium C00003107]